MNLDREHSFRCVYSTIPFMRVRFPISALALKCKLKDMLDTFLGKEEVLNWA